MSRIEETFKRLKREGRPALIPFLVAGDPDLKTTKALVVNMADSGADVIELGVPYSDPLADGPTIQAGYQRALERGVSLRDVFQLARGLKRITPPLVIMTYFNPVFRHGLRAFAEDSKKSGFSGVIIPDLPPEEAKPWMVEARKQGLDTIFLAAPTSPPGRIRMISHFSRGFIYYVSLTGVTGARKKLPGDLKEAVRGIQKQSGKPVAVGFGISTPDQAREVGRFADGVIVGSAIVKLVEKNGKRGPLISRVRAFITSLSGAIRSSQKPLA